MDAFAATPGVQQGGNPFDDGAGIALDAVVPALAPACLPSLLVSAPPWCQRRLPPPLPLLKSRTTLLLTLIGGTRQASSVQCRALRGHTATWCATVDATTRSCVDHQYTRIHTPNKLADRPSHLHKHNHRARTTIANCTCDAARDSPATRRLLPQLHRADCHLARGSHSPTTVLAANTALPYTLPRPSAAVAL